MRSARRIVAIILVGTIFWRSSFAAATDAVSSTETPEKTSSASINPARVAALVFAETNRLRREHGRPALRELPPLTTAADDQAGFMALTLQCTHHSWVKGSQNALQRVERVGLKPGLVTENAELAPIRAMSEPEAAAYLVQGWMDLTGHRANLLSPEVDYLGCAVHIARMASGEDAFFAVQVFFHPDRPLKLAAARQISAIRPRNFLLRCTAHSTLER